jgi:hypothetical protein
MIKYCLFIAVGYLMHRLVFLRSIRIANETIQKAHESLKEAQDIEALYRYKIWEFEQKGHP